MDRVKRYTMNYSKRTTRFLLIRFLDLGEFWILLQLKFKQPVRESYESIFRDNHIA